MTSYYLAGPMSGLPNFNRDAFVEAARLLRENGYEVLNPVEMDLIYGSWEEAIKRPWQEHLARDVDTVVNKADGVILLDGWETSRGANLEVRLARTFDKPIYRYGYRLTQDGPVLQLRLMSADEFDAAARPGDVAAAPPESETIRSRMAAHVEDLASLRASAEDVRRSEDLATELYDPDGAFVSYEANPLRHTFGTGGIKDNRGKPPMDLIPTPPLLAMAEVLAFGARKYRPHNWRRGLPWPDTYSSLQRHLVAWNDGEDLDQETGLSHLAHAECQLTFLLHYVLTGIGEETDNRFIPCPCGLEGLHPTTDHDADAVA